MRSPPPPAWDAGRDDGGVGCCALGKGVIGLLAEVDAIVVAFQVQGCGSGRNLKNRREFLR